jgi:toxin ParE1/3/4
MSEFFVSPRADADLDLIWLYIAGDRPGAADRMVDRLIEHFALLAANPQFGEAYPQLAPDLRRSHVGSYVVLYRPRQERVEIVRVIHGARDVEQEFRRHWFS